MRHALMIPVLAITASCVAGSPAEILSQPAPSLASVVAKIDAFPACGRVVTPPASTNRTATKLLSLCEPFHPTEIGYAGISAACNTMFDLDDSGIPIRAESRCRVDGAKAPAPQAWLDVAEKAYAHAVQRAIYQNRYSPLSDENARFRTNLSQIYTFPITGGRDCLDPPQQFGRPPPAPVPPPFVAERQGPGCPAY